MCLNIDISSPEITQWVVCNNPVVNSSGFSFQVIQVPCCCGRALKLNVLTTFIDHHIILSQCEMGSGRSRGHNIFSNGKLDIYLKQSTSEGGE